jgi:hypothetical protein
VKVDAAGEEERSGAGVVTLDSLHRSSKLCGGVGDESDKCAESVRFETQRKSPQLMSAVIKNYQIIFIT